MAKNDAAERDGFAEFILEHADDDVAALLLSRHKWKGIDVELAASTIESRRKIRRKLPQWYMIPGLMLPSPLSAEQCSSAETAAYKAGILSGICPKRPMIADLTGGLGADAEAFSRLGGEVLYNEMNPVLAAAAGHNFRLLGADNIIIRNCRAGETPVREILGGFSPDAVFVDPARRKPDGRKAFLPEDCSPDVTVLLPELLEASRYVLLKISPMADISMMAGRLNEAAGSRAVKEVHIVAAAGECKELLFLLDREHDGDFVEIVSDTGGRLVFSPSEESGSAPCLPENEEMLPSLRGRLLFEPCKALMKAGAFNLPCSRFGMMKLGRSTHLYITDGIRAEAAWAGDFFFVKEILPLCRSSFRHIGQKWPCAEFTARNIRMTSEQLRARCESRSGGDTHVFGVRIDFRNGGGDDYLIVSDASAKTPCPRPTNGVPDSLHSRASRPDIS